MQNAGKPEGRAPEGERLADKPSLVGGGGFGGITSHVFLSFKYYKSVSSVGLLFLLGSLMGMRVSDDADLHGYVSSIRSMQWYLGSTYALNRAKTTKLSLKVLLICLVRESRNNERLESVATNVGILVRLD